MINEQPAINRVKLPAGIALNMMHFLKKYLCTDFFYC